MLNIALLKVLPNCRVLLNKQSAQTNLIILAQPSTMSKQQ